MNQAPFAVVFRMVHDVRRNGTLHWVKREPKDWHVPEIKRRKELYLVILQKGNREGQKEIYLHRVRKSGINLPTRSLKASGSIEGAYH